MNIDFTVWATIALMHFVAVVSPGPDFAIVIKQSLQKGLRFAIWTSFGIGTGILLHVSYSILGLSLLIKTTSWLYHGLLYAAAGYFVYIGINALCSQPPTYSEIQDGEELKVDKPKENTRFKAFALGFLVNGLNPKATLFFLALFTAAIPAETGLSAKVFYGLYLAIATTIWFCFLSFITSRASIRNAYQAYGYWFDRVMGAVLIIMAIFLVW